MKDVCIIEELFKRVREDEILEDLKKLGVDVKHQAFKNPTSEESLGLYSLAIQVVYGKTVSDIRPEDLHGRLNELPKNINGPTYTNEDVEFLKCGIGNLRFWRYCQKLHESLGLPTIQRCELFDPTPQSFTRLITAFVVYLRFREALYSLFEVRISSLDLLAERDLKLSQDIKTMSKEFHKLRGYKRTRIGSSTALSYEKDQLEMRLKSATLKLEEYKQKRTEIEAELNLIKQKLHQVLISKSQARDYYNDMTEKIGDLKSHLKLNNNKLQLLESRATKLRHQHNSLEEACNLVEELEKYLNNHYLTVLVPNIDDNTFEDIKSQRRSLTEKINILINKRNNLITEVEGIKKLSAEQTKRIELNNRLQTARKCALESEHKANAIRQKTTATQNKIHELNNKMTATKNNSVQIFNNLDNKFNKVINANKQYQKHIKTIAQRLNNIILS